MSGGVQTATTEFSLELATAADEPELQRLMAANQVPGRVMLSHERSAGYFSDCRAGGQDCQVMVVRHGPSGELVAMGCRSIRPRYVNGEVEEVGYLTDLRADPRYRGRWLTARLFRLLQQLHTDGRVGGYLAVLAEANTSARRLLVERAPRHFPTFREVARLCTVALVIREARPVRSSCAVRRAAPADLEAIVAHLQRYGAARQFFPHYTAADFRAEAAPGLGFPTQDFLLASRGGKIVGVAGLWDRSGSRQTVVQAYHGLARWGRPFYNLGARLIGGRPLPGPGERLFCVYGSFISVADEDPGVFDALLQHLHNLARERGAGFLMLGFVLGDPLLRVARRYLHLPYYSRLYTACYPGEERFHERLDGRAPYLELATL